MYSRGQESLNTKKFSVCCYIQFVVVFYFFSTICCSNSEITKRGKMICPYCSNDETKVTDKRDTGEFTRRRRECLKCRNRFTTHEKIESNPIKVIKKGGRREEFNRVKVRTSIEKACEKRPVSAEKVEKMLTKIEEGIRRRGGEVKSAHIGEHVMRELKKTDKVAYIRFASVYRDFADLSDFKKEIRELVKK